MNFKQFSEKNIHLIEERLDYWIKEMQIDPLPFKNGKRLRPLITLLVFDALNGDESNLKQALDLGVACEISHTCSLLLDDYIDDDDERRGKPSYHKLKGISLMLLELFSTLSIPSEIASLYGKKYVKATTSVQRQMAKGVKGEILKKLPATVLYDFIISKKTGVLFSLAAKYGAMSATTDKKICNKFAEYGLRLGKSMQIGDDIGDFHDIINKKKTMDLITGTELIMFNALNIDGLASELKNDVLKCDISLEKVKGLFDNKTIREKLLKMIDNEIDACRTIINDLSKRDDVNFQPLFYNLLVFTPREIVDLKMSGE